MSHIKVPLSTTRFVTRRESGWRSLALRTQPLRQPQGALPARFRRQRVLIVGCGDVGSRAAQVMGEGRRTTLRALTSSTAPERLLALRAQGITPLMGNLDDAASLQRLGALASWAVHLAPPPARGPQDPRTQALVRVWLRALGQLARRTKRESPVLRRLRRLRWRHQATALQALVYGSTTGVYGNCDGDWAAETRAPNPESARAQRRVAAEHSVLQLARQSRHAVRVLRLRIPGIYAPDREGGTPRGRLARGTPCLLPEHDAYTNHIHADDLARAAVRALVLGKPMRAINVCDDTQMKAGDYFDAAADLYGTPRPPRLSPEELQQQVSPMQWSFLRESRRLRNTRMKRELRLVLRHPDVLAGLRHEA